jgi:hypothetical protein
VQGGINIANTMTINGPATIQCSTRARPRVRVVLQAGAEHIDEAQKARLRGLVNEIVQAELAVRRSPKSHAVIWEALKAKQRVASYHMIPRERFPEAEGYLMTWLARLHSMPSARKLGSDWRKSRYAFIKAGSRQIGREADVDTLLADRYGSRRLSELTDDELQAVYQVVGGWKNQARRNGALPPRSVRA